MQFNFDMTRNLFPVIGKYTSKPDNFLKRFVASLLIIIKTHEASKL